MDYLIRACEPTDLGQLVVLCQHHATYEKASYNPEGKKEALHDAIFNGATPLNCLLVQVGNVLVGYATWTFDFSTWDAQRFIYLDCLYLEDEYRNYGIGAVLMEKVKQAGIEKNCVNMQWQTPDFNEHAIRFYKRIGGVGKNKVRFTMDLN
jgi:GNAT superfamily N-acetyltransferase